MTSKRYSIRNIRKAADYVLSRGEPLMCALINGVHGGVVAFRTYSSPAHMLRARKVRAFVQHGQIRFVSTY
jgi:hypothetical protein